MVTQWFKSQWESFFPDQNYFESSILPQNLAALTYAAKSVYRPYKVPYGPETSSINISLSNIVAGEKVDLTASADDTRYEDNDSFSDKKPSDKNPFADKYVSEGRGLSSPQQAKPVVAAHYTIDTPSWIGSPTKYPLNASDGKFDETQEELQGTIDTTGLSIGRHTIFVESQDIDGNWGVPTATFIDIIPGYDVQLVIDKITAIENTSSELGDDEAYFFVRGTDARNRPISDTIKTKETSDFGKGQSASNIVLRQFRLGEGQSTSLDIFVGEDDTPDGIVSVVTGIFSGLAALTAGVALPGAAALGVSAGLLFDQIAGKSYQQSIGSLSFQITIKDGYPQLTWTDGKSTTLKPQNGFSTDEFEVVGAGAKYTLTISAKILGTLILGQSADLRGKSENNLILTGNDEIDGTGNDSANILTGNDVKNTLNGLAGNDVLYGRGGSDILIGGDGSDFMFGGTGDDTYSVDNPADQVIEGKDEGNDTISSSVSYTLSDNVEKLILLEGANAVSGIGNNDSNTILGNNTDNVLVGKAGADILNGGAGADTLDGDSGNDSLDGGSENDKLYGRADDDFLVGGAGSDLIDGGDGKDKLFGQDGDDTLNDPDGVIEAQGGIGNDTINITFASNWDDNDNPKDSPHSDGKIIGGYGDDNITVTMNLKDFSINLKADEDTVENPQDGNDTVTLQENYANSTIYLGGGVNIFNGGLGKDTVFSGSGNDTLFGNAGNDVLIGGTGINQIDGGSETDTIDYQNSSNAVTVNIDRQINYKNVGSPFDLERSFEINAGKAFDDFKTTDDTLVSIEDITASKFNDILIGNSSDNSIFAGLGDDLLIGSDGKDSLDGGDGFDIVSYRRDPGKVLVNLQENTATDGFGKTDRLLNIEGIVGSAFADRIIGNDLVNIFFGDGGDDVIEARGGKDTIYGNDGNDSLFGESNDDKLIGGIGADILNGGDGSDTASYFNAISGIFANLSTGQGTDGDASGDIYQFIENLEGSQFSDRLFGDNQNNSLWGLGGDDILNGFAGADFMQGGFGNDTYFVDDAGDNVSELFDQGNQDLVNSAINYILRSNLENLNLLEGTAALNGTGNELSNIINGNSANNFIDGGTGNDSLFGFAGSDTINGGDGDDWIFGGLGNDILTGGSGSDSFAFNSITDAGDRITDFTVGSDKIVLTEVVNSSGFRSSNFLADGFFSVRAVGSSMAAVMIDPDGAASLFRPAPFLLLNNVSATALNNSSNFTFV